MTTKIVLVALLLSATTGFAQTIVIECSAHDYTLAYGTAMWSGTNHHKSGSHFTTFFPEDRCTYSDQPDSVNGTPCDTDQLGDFVFEPNGAGTGDNGSVQGIGYYHEIENDSQTYLAQRKGAATPPANYYAGTAINECIVGLGCPAYTITVPPFSATGGGIIQTSAQYVENSPGCPLRRFIVRPKNCSCRACGCGSPLMFDASGIGPFRDIEGNGSNFYQLTGIDKDAIWFRLSQQNGSWEKTKPQRVAWTKPRSTMLVLVLPNADGTITNGDNLFGNVTHCSDRLCHDGFEALKYKCDNPLFGGNGDGYCNSQDALWYQLRWLSGRPGDRKAKLYRMQDISQQLSFDLRNGAYYEVQSEEQFRDEHGNHARYRGVVNLGWKDYGDHGMVSNSRILWDVWLLDDISKDEDAEWHQ